MPLLPTAEYVKNTALRCGFDLAGIAPVIPHPDFSRYQEWVSDGMAGEMNYLTDHRADLRADPRQLLPSAKTVLCVGKLYNSPHPHSTQFNDDEKAWISRYAWGDDYHDVLRAGLSEVVEQLKAGIEEPFESRICVDTAPLLERSYARSAGLGWIGRNTCLINQNGGSWFFLGELLLSLDLKPDTPAPARCGTCRRCIDACPTSALVPQPDGSWALDARLCISYFTIEKRGPLLPEAHPNLGQHIFGCDICQDVCPWNSREPVSDHPAFQPRMFHPPLAQLADLSEEEFRRLFRRSPVWRTKYAGFLRNVAAAMGSSGKKEFRAPLEKLAQHGNAVVAETARAALEQLTA